LKIIVTGSAGYIGGTFCHKLLAAGHEVIGLDNYINSDKKVSNFLLNNFNSYSFHQIDIAKVENPMDEIFRKHKGSVDCVVHFAALKAVGESESKPVQYWENNIISTLNLIKAMRSYDMRKLIFSSSATVYGNNANQPLTESESLSPISCYGSTKIANEYLLNDVAKTGDIDVVLLRYFNPVGAHSESIIYDDPYASPNNIMPRVIRVALGIEEQLYIWGNDYPSKDGTGARDYIHIEDLVEGHISAIDFIKTSSGSTAFNLGTGNSITVLELIKKFENVNNIKIPISFEKRREGDVAECYADPAKAQNILKWKAKKTLEEMCKSSWKPFLK
tara:strand:+ start:802 stop:1797 length:996 start_codon:yes stop_codon:yes gene_type:complete